MSSSPQMSYEVLGAVKIKDGVFVGDELAAQDLEFVVANKVTHVINCCGRQVPNHWEPIGVVYLTYYWVDNESQIILDPKDVVVNEIVNFIEECLNHAESVLIHSVRGQSRSCCVLAAYMMRKYSWTLRKTMEFLMARRPDLNLKPSFLQQLSSYERRLRTTSKLRLTEDWNLSGGQNPLECEELLLRNTYMNSQMAAAPELSHQGRTAIEMRDSHSPEPQRLVWADGAGETKSRLEKTAEDTKPHNKRNSAGQMVLKSILKNGVTLAMRNAQFYFNSSAQLNERMAYQRGDEKRKAKENPSLQSRPTTASSETETLSLRTTKLCWSGREQDMLINDRDRREKPISAWEEEDDHGPGRSLSRDDRPSSSQRMPSPSYGSKNDFNSRIKDDFSNGGGRFLPGSKSSTLSRSSDRYDNSPHSGGVPVKLLRRDASPKQDRDRLSLRSDSPLRLLTKNPNQSMQKPANFSKNFCLGQLPSRSSNSSFISASGPVRVSGTNGVMGAYRTGGPVKAKVDLLADGLRKQRPATAPSTRTPHNRPASPLGVCRQSSSIGSNSRPSSPSMRAAGPPKSLIPPSIYEAGTAMYNSGTAQKHSRSLSSHMRRAPSPTPAFNRTASPGKPRWRM